MAEQVPFQAVADTLTLKLPRDLNGVVAAILSGGAAPVGFTVVLELSYDEAVTWEVATLTRPDRTTVAALASGQSGWCEAPGATHARLRVTARTSGTQGARLEWRKG
jgi:hypothetical protein